MGYQTVIVLLNDRISEIEQDPKRLVDEIRSGLSGLGESERIFGQGNGHGSFFIGQTTVFPSGHADGYQVVVAHGHMAVSLNRSDLTNLSDHDMEIVREFAERARVQAGGVVRQVDELREARSVLEFIDRE